MESNPKAARKRAIMSGTPYVITKQFPWKLHEMLDLVQRQGDDHIVSWLPGGRSFRVHMPELFVERIMKLCFNQTKYKSFQRQLNLWGFERNSTECIEKGAYSHPLFVRGRKDLCQEIARAKVKGNKQGNEQLRKGPSSRQPEPPMMKHKFVSPLPEPTTEIKAPSIDNSLVLQLQNVTNAKTIEALGLLNLSRQSAHDTLSRTFDPIVSRAIEFDRTSLLYQSEQDALTAIRARATMNSALQAIREREQHSTAMLVAALQRSSQHL